ncbi:MAG: hypothetical protein JWN56_1699 [Sphingobacteriales bacterium]|nr:hypothetical protein [Sphingobacteriales bacterium]
MPKNGVKLLKISIFENHPHKPSLIIIWKLKYYCFKTQAKISGATIVASDSTMNLGV